jgi:osmotically-inducible protein OsmY
MRFRTINMALALGLTTAVIGCNRQEAPDTATQVPAQTQQSANPQQDDASLTTAVQAKYYGDDDVRGRDIRVVTENGVVTLNGTVDSEGARERAVALAREVPGVTRVEDELRVQTASADTGAAPAPAEGATGTTGRDATVTPAWITTKIQAQYFVSPEVKPWNVDVTTGNNGVVTLEGEVETAADKTEAVRIARATEGVTRVDDRLRIEGETEPTAPADTNVKPVPNLERPDLWLTAKIQSKFFLDDAVKGHEINVNTNEAVVTLEGRVENEAQRRQAIALARSTEGVKDVVDRLTVAPADAGPGTPGATAPGARRDVDTDMKRPDEWITMKIQSKYFLDTTVKGRKIDVETKSGVVTLTGTVGTEAEKKQAAEMARETEGVTRVVNQLTISAVTGDQA